MAGRGRHLAAGVCRIALFSGVCFFLTLRKKGFTFRIFFFFCITLQLLKWRCTMGAIGHLKSRHSVRAHKHTQKNIQSDAFCFSLFYVVEDSFGKKRNKNKGKK